MKVLVVGGGGREHALAWKIAQSPRVERILCAPGNAGTSQETRCENREVSAENIPALLDLAKREKIDFTVVGPDQALADGLVDEFARAGLRIFGPTKSAARFESSKIFTKDFLKRHGIPAAESASFDDPVAAYAYAQKLSPRPLVIKADGLALGKGVVIARTGEDACRAIYRMMEAKAFGAAGERILIEEFLEGQEASVHALIDGERALLFPAAQDHKRIHDRDEGPNTGGMGTYSPPPILGPERAREVEEKILKPFLAGCRAEGIRFQGLLFPGLMITKEGLKVLEFNARFGDPETQSLMRRLDGDLLELLEATVDGKLDRVKAKFKSDSAVCVVMAAEGYPGAVRKGDAIEGLNEAAVLPGVKVFHAGTKAQDSKILTSGGRVLGVTALAPSLAQARDRAYEAVERIRWRGAQYRRDIGLKGLG
ncbi:MAG: phosphoribosylamine--glycine ligase [Verrucomicrobiae bacterium]|nr:phosphoribosylamine--glycine ligase [Verrucomicrobiae bacterium]